MAIRKPGIGISEAVVLERLARLMRAAEHEGDLNPAQWEALRYIGRANRFSNSPGALTQYLGATKGTVSQTVIALEKKGLVAKGPRPEERRSVSLTLTESGGAMLARDPWQRLGAEIDKLGPKTRKRFARALRDLLQGQLARGNFKSFGVCRSCRYFGEKAGGKEPGGPHRCLLFNAPLTGAESRKICVEHLAV
jgi:DNA-binding MarR family transcriptional regulator